ncbi:hypothetical protein [Larkinella arboricola]
MPRLLFSDETGTINGVAITAGVYALANSAADPSSVVSKRLFQLTVNEAPPMIKRTGNVEGYLDAYHCERYPGLGLGSAKYPLDRRTIFRMDLVSAGKETGNQAYCFTTPPSLKKNRPREISAGVLNRSYTFKDSPGMLTGPLLVRLSAESAEANGCIYLFRDQRESRLLAISPERLRSASSHDSFGIRATTAYFGS